MSKLLPVAILTASAWLLSGCALLAKKPARPDLPLSFHFMEPGSVHTIVVPTNCLYAVWTTDRGLIYLQGISGD